MFKIALTDKSSKKTGLFLVVVLVIVILIIALVVGGAQGIFSVLKIFLIALFVAGFLGFLFYIIYFLFFKVHKIDIPYENWKSYVQSAQDNGSDMMEDLVLTGDKNHSSKSFMKIMGYLRILAFDNKEYDLFIGKRNTKNPFEEIKMVMLHPDEHTDLIGDVYVYGISLIQKYGYYFLNNTLLDFQAIDTHVAKDSFRTMMYYVLGDMKGLIDRATGLDPDYAKERQREKLLKIPVLSGQENK